MPNFLGWVVRGIARVWKGWMWPGMAAAAVWTFNQLNEAVAGVIFYVGGSFLAVVFAMLGAVSWPDPIEWSRFGALALQLIRLAGLDVAVGIFISAAALRLVVRVMTLGRF